MNSNEEDKADIELDFTVEDWCTAMDNIGAFESLALMEEVFNKAPPAAVGTEFHAYCAHVIAVRKSKEFGDVGAD